MAAVRLPITNVLMQGDYTGILELGALGKKLNVILDTGSSTLAVDGHAFDPNLDHGTTTTQLAQAVQYGSGSWVGAVVETTVAFDPTTSLGKVKLAVTYHQSNMFEQCQGIFGLAYPDLNNAFQMPADTWQSRYDYDQIQRGKPSTIDPYFSQLEESGGVANKFAFYTKRSSVSHATANPAADPANQGFLIVGGGEEQADLYTGAFTKLAVVHDLYYNTNLLSVRIGDQPPIQVAPIPATDPAGSNSIIDSGTNGLSIAQPLYEAMIAAFTAVNPGFGTALVSACFASDGFQPMDQTKLHLADWPPIVFTFQGADGQPASVAVAPKDYWQFDATAKGMALTTLYGDGGSGGGQSILGLPLFNGYFVVFDRSADNGQGAIGFATRT